VSAAVGSHLAEDWHRSVYPPVSTTLLIFAFRFPFGAEVHLFLFLQTRRNRALVLPWLTILPPTLHTYGTEGVRFSRTCYEHSPQYCNLILPRICAVGCFLSAHLQSPFGRLFAVDCFWVCRDCSGWFAVFPLITSTFTPFCLSTIDFSRCYFSYRLSQCGHPL